MGCNACAPLKAVFFLKQSREPGAVPATHAQKVDLLFRQLLMPVEPERMMRLLNMADKLVSSVPFYVLSCDMTEASVLCAYHAVKEGAPE